MQEMAAIGSNFGANQQTQRFERMAVAVLQLGMTRNPLEDLSVAFRRLLEFADHDQGGGRQYRV
jgi:hypothetical protein